MWVLAGIFVALLLLLSLRIKVMAQYSEDGPVVYGGLGPVRVKVYPRPKEKQVKKKRDKPPKEPKAQSETGGAVEKFQAGLSVVGPMFKQVRQRLVISEITLHYTVATDDAAKTALMYGGAQAAVNQMMPMLCGQFRVKKRDVRVGVDFDSAEPPRPSGTPPREGNDRIFVRVKLAISVWGALRLGLFAINKLRKSGLILQGGRKHGQASHQ